MVSFFVSFDAFVLVWIAQLVSQLIIGTSSQYSDEIQPFIAFINLVSVLAFFSMFILPSLFWFWRSKETSN